MPNGTLHVGSGVKNRPARSRRVSQVHGQRPLQPVALAHDPDGHATASHSAEVLAHWLRWARHGRDGGPHTTTNAGMTRTGGECPNAVSLRPKKNSKINLLRMCRVARTTSMVCTVHMYSTYICVYRTILYVQYSSVNNTQCPATSSAGRHRAGEASRLSRGRRPAWPSFVLSPLPSPLEAIWHPGATLGFWHLACFVLLPPRISPSVWWAGRTVALLSFPALPLFSTLLPFNAPSPTSRTPPPPPPFPPPFASLLKVPPLPWHPASTPPPPH